MVPFKEFLTEGKSHHHKVAVEHGYRVGTKVGTTGYYTVGGGFTHVYYHPKSGHELHVHTQGGVPDKWVHVSEDGVVHRTGIDHKELYNHFTIFHPEIAEQKKKEAEKKAKEAARAKKAKKKPKKKTVKEVYSKPFKSFLMERLNKE